MTSISIIVRNSSAGTTLIQPNRLCLFSQFPLVRGTDYTENNSLASTLAYLNPSTVDVIFQKAHQALGLPLQGQLHRTFEKLQDRYNYPKKYCFPMAVVG